MVFSDNVLMFSAPTSMNKENRPLVLDEHVEFEKQLVKIQDFRKITDPFAVIYKIFLDLGMLDQKMSTCRWWILETLGSRPLMPQNLLGHCPITTYRSTYATNMG